MGGVRKREYLDVYLNVKDVRKLKKGYTVIKQSKGKWISIHRDQRNRGVVREIERLRKKIVELKGGKRR